VAGSTPKTPFFGFWYAVKRGGVISAGGDSAGGGALLRVIVIRSCQKVRRRYWYRYKYTYTYNSSYRYRYRVTYHVLEFVFAELAQHLQLLLLLPGLQLIHYKR
jgi:hypothetical protein